MFPRSLAFASAIGISIVLAASHRGWCADSSNLNAAFSATFGQYAPFARSIQAPIYDMSQPPKVLRTEQHVFSVRPKRLVGLGDGKYALVSYEIDIDGTHSTPGAIAVAYLEKTATRWKLKQL